MPAPTSSLKKPVNLSLSDELVRESRSYCGNLSAKVEENCFAQMDLAILRCCKRTWRPSGWHVSRTVSTCSRH